MYTEVEVSRQANQFGNLIIKFSRLKSASRIYCNGVYYNKITVTEVRKLLEGYIKFTLSKPIEMD